MRALHSLGVTFAILMLAGGSTLAQDKDKNPVEGKWELKQTIGGKDVTGQIEFAKDNKLVLSIMNITFEGKYKVVNKDTLEVSITLGEKTTTENAKFKVDKDTLELTDKDGKTEKLTRVKDKK